MKKNIFHIACSFLLLLFILSCTPNPEQKLIGKWQNANGKEVIEFQRDRTFHGTLIWDMPKSPLTVSGTYSVSGNLVSVRPEKPQNLKPMTWEMSFSKSGDELRVVFKEGGALKLDGSTAVYRKTG